MGHNQGNEFILGADAIPASKADVSFMKAPPPGTRLFYALGRCFKLEDTIDEIQSEGSGEAVGKFFRPKASAHPSES